jgi:hypothetical protein
MGRLSVFTMLALVSPLSATGQLQQYDRVLERLSEPAATRWQHFGSPYYSTNEKLLNRFYSRFDNAGGATVGVSFQQNLSLLVHARPKLCVIFDYNPGLTEILVPFMGQLMAESPTRREFVSRLLGADINEEETRQLLSGQTPVATVLGAVLERSPQNARKVRLDELRARLRPPASATAYVRGEVRKWIDILENEELLTGVFFADAINGSKTPGGAGWLSTEENYALVRSYWISGKIIGVTGDISGPSVAKLGAYLRNLHLEVTTLYVSNVGLSIEGHFPEKWFRDLYTTLGTLPVSPTALTLIAHGPWQLTGFVRPLKQAQWVYQTLADAPEETVIRLHEAPLEILTQQGNAHLLAAVRQGLVMINAPSLYVELINQIQADPRVIRELSPDQFREWSAKKVSGVDTGSAVFRTVMVTLAEAGFIQLPAR